MRRRFTELTDSQWQFIAPRFSKQKPKKLSLRSVLNALLYITTTGTQWRNLPAHYPAWQSVYYYFAKWQKEGTLLLIMNDLRIMSRRKAGKKESPSLLIIDSQSIKIAPFIGQGKGFDGHKKVNGRKRHLAVDTLGYPLAVYVGGANENDGQAGLALLAILDKQQDLPYLTTIRGDYAYKGTFTRAAQYFHWQVDTRHLVATIDKGLVVQKNRWQIERTFGWLNFYRRLSKDYEKTTKASEAFIVIALCSVMLAKII